MTGGNAARVVAGVLLGLSAAAADETYWAESLKWREEREAWLKADGGWLTVAGLFWVKEGPSRLGTDPSLEIVPCAFTPYATCPLPPPQNWLPVRVEAGPTSS